MTTTDKSYVKIKRASKRIGEISDALREKRAFRYVLETNAITFERATYAKPNEPVLDEIADACGEVANSLRSALDHVYWSIVSPFASNDRERKAVMFPFCERLDRLDEAVKNRLANRVSGKFFDAIMALRPYHEAGGNTFLCLVDRIAVEDKHRTLTPIADYAHIPGSLIKRLCPGAPTFIGGISFVDCHRHFVWKNPIRAGEDLGDIVPPFTSMFEKEIDLPVPVVFPIWINGQPAPLIPTLNQMVDMTNEAIGIMRRAA